jgi:hypothetical protein
MLLPGRINMTEDSSIFEDLDDHVFDPDAAAGSLEYSLGAGTPDWIELTGGHFMRISPQADWSGDIDIPVRVSDGMEHVEGLLALSVIPVNDPPVLRGIGGDMTCRADRPFILDLDPYDAEGEALTFDLISAVEGLTITGYSLRIVPTEDQIGVHIIVINVSDPEGAFTIWGFNLSISAAFMALYFSEPSVHLPDATVGEAYEHAMVLMGEMAGNATFSDNTTLFDIDPSTGIIAFVPGADDVGEHWVRITASSGNESASRAFVIVVKQDEEYPTWLVWALALAATALLATAIALFVWRGRRVPQYGEE